MSENSHVWIQMYEFSKMSKKHSEHQKQWKLKTDLMSVKGKIRGSHMMKRYGFMSLGQSIFENFLDLKEYKGVNFNVSPLQPPNTLLQIWTEGKCYS